jgi:hypothetical protein
VFANKINKVVRDQGRSFSVAGVNVAVQVFHDVTKHLFRFLVQVADGDTGGKNGIVWMRGCEIGSLVELVFLGNMYSFSS